MATTPWRCVHGVTGHEWCDVCAEELGEPDTLDWATVCIVHKRFVPCRWKTDCFWSSDLQDVAEVRRYQRYEDDAA